MKVHELINDLLGMPAGADVKVNQTLTVEEVTKSEVADVDNGVEIYSLTRNVEEAEESNDDSVVYLYTD